MLDANNDEHFKLLKMTRQQFKDAMLKDYMNMIAYVDVEKNSSRVLIRCKCAESARKMLDDEKFLASFEKSLLEGEQEDDYFEKIDASRSKKQGKKEKKATKDNLDKPAEMKSIKSKNVFNKNFNWLVFSIFRLGLS